MDRESTQSTRNAAARTVGRRLRDWWRGADSDESMPRRGRHRVKEEVLAWAGRGTSEPNWRALSIWSPGRQSAAETLWGEGRIRPENGQFAGVLTAPFDFERVSDASDFNSGPKGVSPEIAGAFPTVPTAWSRHEELVAQARHFADSHSGAALQRLHVPDIPGVETAPVSAVLAFDIVHAYVDKRQIFEVLRSRLKPGGQFVFTDFARNSADTARGALSDWRQVEAELFFDAPSEHWRLCREQGLEIDDMTDITEAYCGLIAEVMPRVKDQLYGLKKPGRTAQHLRYEFELYARRLEALSCGAARLLRFYGEAEGT